MPGTRTAGSILLLTIPVFVATHAFAADDASAAASTSSVRTNVVRPDVIQPNVFLIGAPVYETDQSSDEEVRRLFSLYVDARSAGVVEEADSLAKQIVEMSISSFGRDSKDTARALTNLANLQASNDENAAAIQNYTAAIGIVESLDSRLSLDLLMPLKALGAVELQAGNGDRAQDAWTRAVHISHVNMGPHNFQQIETLQSMARLFSDSGMNKEAKRTYKRIEYLRSRFAEESRIDVLPIDYDGTR
jgi:tetratricopeptide (TPR) repeat protein